MNGSEQPDVINVTATRKEEVPADYADLFVIIKGTSFFTGGAALSKAREVSQLVSELTRFGVEEKDIQLLGVTAEVSSGTLSRSSTARYSLKVRCSHLDFLADVLGIATSQKNAELRSIQWGYEREEEARSRLLDACIAEANEKAHKIAAGLAVRLLGVHSFSEGYGDDEGRNYTIYPLGAPSPPMRARAARVTSEELGLEITHAKTVHAQVTVQYLVSRFADAR